MDKCLVTKLSGSSSNTALLKMGEMRIKFNKSPNVSKSNRSIQVASLGSITLEIIGDGYFTDSNMSSSLGKTKIISNNKETLYLSNNNFEVSIMSKYNISEFIDSDNNDPTKNKEKSINIEDFKYSTQLRKIQIIRSNGNGDISCLSNLKNLTDITIFDDNIFGSIDSFRALVNLQTISLYGAKFEGNISALSNMKNLSYISLNSPYITGDINNFSSLPNLSSIICNDVPGLYGDVSNLSSNSLTSIYLGNASLMGDLSKIGPSCTFFTNSGGKSTFTWTERPSSAKILALEGPLKIDNIDKMLQDQAQCQVGITSDTEIWFKTISAKGTRTSASDAAVQTLQSKGYTVSITPAQ